jgi:hypothetical protein
MAIDKVEAVKKVTETLNKQSMNPAEDIERMASNKEHFQSLIDSPQALKPTSFERLDTKAFAPEDVQSIETEKNPIFAEENVSSQKSGTATDQEGQRKGQQEVEEVDGVASTKSKTSTAPQSLMDEVGNLHTNVSNMSQLSPEAIKTQAKQVISQLDQVKSQLSQAKTEIKPSYQTLLRNRLTHIDDNLKIALSKAGVEHTPPPTTGKAEKTNPIQRFINMVSDSQHQLENIHNTVDQLNIGGTQISPANMLAIQIKMGYIQQQIELFTSLLNKALESTKTIMNVQV